ncbi:DNA-processing protein DprA [Microbacterium sediminis]|uniref:DNA-processing protein DprA n=1 Tax=Microbacterium sediminis TaxID=904291 RepID=UPI0009FFC70E|nr:DNA-protecting protein DprA [Microbacterium sediminis]
MRGITRTATRRGVPFPTRTFPRILHLPQYRREAAIVGARAATSYGEHVATELAGDLALEGVAVVSGAAYGIDGAAHRAALREGGLTVAVLAGGVDRVYPAGHAHLLARIAETGAVISEVAPGTAPTKFRFLQRNRLIAALSGATVVVEAGWSSGSLNTASHAASLARPIGAVPGSITSAQSAGCHRLLREYGAVCVTCAADVGELLGLAGDAGAPSPIADPRLVRVADALGTRVWRTAEELAVSSGLAIDDVEAALGTLALEGRAEREGAAWRLGAA